MLVTLTLALLKDLVGDIFRAVDALIKEFNLGMIFVLLQVCLYPCITMNDKYYLLKSWFYHALST